MSHRVLVTGATGFVGGRLVEKLFLAAGRPVRALVRDFSRCARIARFPVELCPGSLHDAAALRAAVADCEVVYHCAHDFGSAEVNALAAAALTAACATTGARLVHVSSMVVYSAAGAVLTEDSPPAAPGNDYVDAKVAAEQAVLQTAASTGAQVTVVQPTTIYGPYCPAWTVGPALQLRSGRLVLPRDSVGLCNAVYIDDVVDALLAAGTQPAAVGERFLVSGPAPVSWTDFYGAYDRLLGTNAVTLWDDARIEAALGDSGAARARQWRANPKRLLEVGLVRRAYDRVRGWTGQGFWDTMKTRLPPPDHLPDSGLLALYRSRTTVRCEKARQLLGYKPAFDLERGMHLSGAWLRWANL
ncbi:MAG: NAD-dependent epimerase/dehydratase family protein [Fimbriimonadaceae bacterium]|nr:NAD-dependent epimerase/dehydratase family protein [Fimbriimonadaceae bacterium]